jgi:hypothetical protein
VRENGDYDKRRPRRRCERRDAPLNAAAHRTDCPHDQDRQVSAAFSSGNASSDSSALPLRL